MKIVKSFLSMVVLGAGATVGTFLAKEGIEIVRDPFKRAEVEQKIKSIKNAILKKDEES